MPHLKKRIYHRYQRIGKFYITQYLSFALRAMKRWRDSSVIWNSLTWIFTSSGCSATVLFTSLNPSSHAASELISSSRGISSNHHKSELWILWQVQSRQDACFRWHVKFRWVVTFKWVVIITYTLNHFLTFHYYKGLSCRRIRWKGNCWHSFLFGWVLTMSGSAAADRNPHRSICTVRFDCLQLA